jgi:hypothetical protein
LYEAGFGITSFIGMAMLGYRFECIGHFYATLSCLLYPEYNEFAGIRNGKMAGPLD